MYVCISDAERIYITLTAMYIVPCSYLRTTRQIIRYNGFKTLFSFSKEVGGRW